jgi:RNA ligase
MKINLSDIDKEEFKIQEEILNEEAVYLIGPKEIGVHWNKDNLIFRSSLWNSAGELISAGFPKFFNWGENVQLSPVPTSLEHASILEKVDGSLLIVSNYKDNFIYRTRGTVNAYHQKNSNEIEILKSKYPKTLTINNEFSMLFEWITPSNKIIINYGENVDFILVGCIWHKNYQLFTQNELNQFAVEFDLKRPKIYSFNLIDEMMNTVKELKGAEGVVVYTNNGQTMHKAKGAWYLSLHHMKNGLSSLSKTVDVWMSFKKPNYENFYKTIHDQFDFEIAEYCKDFLLEICEANKKVEIFLNDMLEKIKEIKFLSTRKDQALKIVSLFKSCGQTGLAFNLLDDKMMTDDQYKNLMFMFLDKRKEK